MHRQHRGPDYTPATRRSAAPAPLAPPAAPQPTAALSERLASGRVQRACNVLVVLGRRAAAMHARSAGVKVILIARDTLLSCVLRALNLEWNGAVVFNEEDSRF
jgi:hypothetical protein